LRKNWHGRVPATASTAAQSLTTLFRLYGCRASNREAWLEASSHGSLSLAVNPNQRIKRQKVDVIEREFHDGGAVEAGGAGAVIDTEIDGMVAPLLCAAFGGPAILVV
jgi:hypothetical protein